MDHIRHSRLTDLEFVYTPSQTAAAAWYLASPELTESWGRAKGMTEESMRYIRDASVLIAEEEARGETDVEFVREIDRRLRVLKGMRDRAREKQERAVMEAKKARKAQQAARKSMASMEDVEDVFGTAAAEGKVLRDQSNGRNPFVAVGDKSTLDEPEEDLDSDD